MTSTKSEPKATVASASIVTIPGAPNPPPFAVALPSRSGGLRPRYVWRITIGGRVYLTTDPIQVARIRRAYPHAKVEILPASG